MAENNDKKNDQILYLPKGPVLTVQGKNFWTNQRGDGADTTKLLSEIANTLSAQGLEKDGEAVLDEISIPSPMSRFVMFEIALTNKGLKKIHDEAKNEFFGILTLIALRNIKSIPIEIKNINFSDAQTAAEKKFTAALQNNFKLVNTLVKDDANSILRRGMCKVILNNKTIAFLSDSTIVCPPFEYSPEIKNDIQRHLSQIYENGKFKEIKDYFKNRNGNIEEVDHVAIYALELYARELHSIFVGNENVASHSHAAAMKEMLKEFRDEAEKLKNAIRTTAKVKEENLKLDHGMQTNAFKTDDLIRNLEPIYEINRNSDLSVRSSKTNNSNKRLIVVSLDSICNIKQDAPEASGIVIFDNVAYSVLPTTFKSGDTTINGINVPNDDAREYLIYKADDLLKDALYLIRREEKSTKIFNSLLTDRVVSDEYEVILPVHEKLLEYMTTKELNDAIDVKVSGNGEYTVTLTLNLEYGTHKIVKNYRSTDPSNASPKAGEYKILNDSEVPAMDIFPYFEVYKDGVPNNMFKDYTIFSISKFDKSGQLNSDAGSSAFYAEPYFSENTSKDETFWLNNVSNAERTLSYRHVDRLPTALQLHRVVRNDSNKYDIGVMLLSEPKRIEVLNDNKWTIAVDFGTTSTTAYYVKQGTLDHNVKAEFISIGKEFRREANGGIRDAGGERQSKLIINSPIFELVHSQYFIDEHYMQRNAYLTAYEKLGDERRFTDLGLRNGRVVWHDERNMDDIRDDEKRKANVDSNIKWGPQDAVVESEEEAAEIIASSIAKSAYYLHQILTHVVCAAVSERVSSINWRFSYPTSLSGLHLSSFKANVRKIMRELSESTAGIVTEDVSFCTESCAAAWYYINRYNDNYFACVDIGGGSSDISLWEKGGSENALIYQTSIKYASRDIFVRPFKSFVTDENIAKAITDSAGNDGSINNRLNSIGSSIDDPITIELLLVEYLGIIRGVGDMYYSNPAYKKLVKRVLVGFLGIMYYVTNSMIQQIKDNKDIDGKSVCIALAGKGSLMYEWLQGCLGSEAIPLTDAMSAYVKKECGKNVTFRLKFERDNLKTEAAQGMLRGAKLDSASESDGLPLIAGIDLTLKMEDGSKETLNTLDDMKKLQFNKIASIEMETLESIASFVEFYNGIIKQAKEAGKEYEIVFVGRDDYDKTSPQLTAIRNSIDSKLSNFLKAAKEEEDVENVEVDPFFISVLKGGKEGDDERSGFMKEFVK